MSKQSHLIGCWMTKFINIKNVISLMKINQILFIARFPLPINEYLFIKFQFFFLLSFKHPCGSYITALIL